MVATGASAAEISWKAGVDVLTFGLTKTGAMGCEIILLFGKARQKKRELEARAKRSGLGTPQCRCGVLSLDGRQPVAGLFLGHNA